MRSVFRIACGFLLLLAGAGLLVDGSVIRNPFVHSAVVVLDMKEPQCRKAPVAPGSACPAGCEAKPWRSPEEQAAPPECHSRFWMATCGGACDPKPGYLRLPDGRLADAGRMLVVLEREPDEALMRDFTDARVSLAPRFDGLYRYDVVLTKGVSFQKTKKRLAALPGVRSVEDIVK